VATDITSEITLGGVDFQLWFATDILRLQSLHYGYWDNPGEITLDLEAARKAQTRYTEYLVSSIPPGVSTILDVGCGVGCNARALAAKGYKVTSLSPDANHKAFFANVPADQIHFCSSKYEDFFTDQKFDLVLMSESQNYFDADVGLSLTHRFLSPHGYLLICGMFRKQNGPEFSQTRHVESEYLLRAQQHGFEMVDIDDITQNTLPTLHMVRMAKQEYLDPALNVARRSGVSASWKVKVAAVLFRKELGKLKEIERYYDEFGDPDFFARHVSYLRILFRKNGK
jgi:SAM-dependent methyltransferase